MLGWLLKDLIGCTAQSHSSAQHREAKGERVGGMHFAAGWEE